MAHSREGRARAREARHVLRTSGPVRRTFALSEQPEDGPSRLEPSASVTHGPTGHEATEQSQPMESSPQAPRQPKDDAHEAAIRHESRSEQSSPAGDATAIQTKKSGFDLAQQSDDVNERAELSTKPNGSASSSSDPPPAEQTESTQAEAPAPPPPSLPSPPPPPPRGHVALLTKLRIGRTSHTFVQPAFCPAVSAGELGVILKATRWFDEGNLSFPSNPSGKVAFVVLNPWDSRHSPDEVIIGSVARACAGKGATAVIMGLPPLFDVWKSLADWSPVPSWSHSRWPMTIKTYGAEDWARRLSTYATGPTVHIPVLLLASADASVLADAWTQAAGPNPTKGWQKRLPAIELLKDFSTRIFENGVERGVPSLCVNVNVNVNVSVACHLCASCSNLCLMGRRSPRRGFASLRARSSRTELPGTQILMVFRRSSICSPSAPPRPTSRST